MSAMKNFLGDIPYTLPEDKVTISLQDYYTLETGNEETLTPDQKREYALALALEGQLA